MSLIPYQPREGREIVLRHRNAVVVRDPSSQRLEIRGAECPTCHQPLGRSPPTDASFDPQYSNPHESYVDPGYFRMLRTGNHSNEPEQPPSSPIRRLVQPALTSGSGRAPSTVSDAVDDDAEFVSSAPGVNHADGGKIKREAFSPNYFKTFFIEEKVLGKGGKGVVLLVRHEIDGCQLGHFACKRVPVGDDHGWLEKVLIEVELLAKLSHPNLVSYRHVWLEDVRLTMFGPSVACAFILQQYCNGGDLHQYVIGGIPREATKEELKEQIRRRSKGQAEPPRNLFNNKPQLSFDDIYSLFKDITSGVAYLHAANYIHRDLKPSNCLLHREGGKMTCLISDFGEVQHEDVVRKSTGSTGTISYCAPEVLRMEPTGHYANFTTKSDMFSLGMILYFMCFGRLPYQGANAIQEELEDIEQLRAEITDWQGFQDERRERPDLPAKLYQLLKKLLSLDPLERPSANEVLTAMKSETNFDGLTRGERNLAPSANLRGNRVQNLDSPAPGTPTPESHREQPQPGLLNHSETETWADFRPVRNRSVSPTKTSHGPKERSQSRPSPYQARTMTISRSQEGFQEPSFDNEQDSLSNTSDADRRLSSPHLLMPPPPSRGLPHKLAVAIVRIGTSLGVSQLLLKSCIRLAVFLVKISTLVRPCWPYMASLQVSIPLIVVAALDLGLPGMTTPSVTIQPRRSNVSTRMPGLGASLTLFVFHFVALWIASRQNALCVTLNHEEWIDW